MICADAGHDGSGGTLSGKHAIRHTQCPKAPQAARFAQTLNVSWMGAEANSTADDIHLAGRRSQDGPCEVPIRAIAPDGSKRVP